MDKHTKVYMPRWARFIYVLMALILVPWIFYLAVELPARHVVFNWDSAWVGFDLIMLGWIGLTIYFVAKRSIWSVMAASALGTIFLIDAWFEIITARNGAEQMRSWLFGLMSLILAGLTYRFAYVVMANSVPRRRFRYTHKRGPRT